MCVCVSVCLCRLLQLLSASKGSSHVFLDFNSWICKIMLRSRVDLLTWNAQCEAKLVHVVLLLYLAVSSALER